MRGVEVKALKKNEEIVETLGERILGRVALNNIVDPRSNDIILKANSEIKEEYLFNQLV